MFGWFHENLPQREKGPLLLLEPHKLPWFYFSLGSSFLPALVCLRFFLQPGWHSGKVLALIAGDLEVDPRVPWSNHTSDLNIGTVVTTLPGAWHCRVSAGTGRVGVSILGLGEIPSLIFNFCLNVEAPTVVQATPSVCTDTTVVHRYSEIWGSWKMITCCVEVILQLMRIMDTVLMSSCGSKGEW